VSFLLDTNAWVSHFRQKNQSVTQHLHQHYPSEIFLCSVVLAELCYGAMRSGAVRQVANLALISGLRSKFSSLPFDDAAAEVYGLIRFDLEAAGTPIGPNDLIIAWIAHVNGLTLVTHNIAEFSRVQGLKIEDWQAP
jgi:tRNA(fMet)-specific endonuclease VapC